MLIIEIAERNLKFSWMFKDLKSYMFDVNIIYIYAYVLCLCDLQTK